jgi:general nucleoside transport system permease protein
MSRSRVVQLVAAPLIALLVSIVVSSIVLAVAGYNPFDAFEAMWLHINGTDALVDAVNDASPYYVSGLAAAIGFKMGLFNIGVEGQYRMAAFWAAVIGAKVSLPAALHLPFILLVAMVFGAAWASVPAVLAVKRNVNVVISTIMLNSITIALVSLWLKDRRFRHVEGEGDLIPRTKTLDRSGWMPDLNAAIEKLGFHFPANTRLHGYLVLAACVGVIFYVLVWRTRFGFDLRMSGANPSAARVSGVNPSRMIVITMLMSGGLAGLVGMGQMLSEGHLFGDQFPPGLGFAGIAVALLGRNHPAGIAFAAFVWSALETASIGLSGVGVPQEIARILQGTLLLSAVIVYEILKRRNASATVRAASAATRPTNAEEVAAV